MQIDGIRFLTVRELHERAWSRSMIRDFLGNPDERQRDPDSPQVGSPFRLYRAERVFHVEGTAAFAERIAVAARRALVGRAGAEKRRQALLAWAHTVPLAWRASTPDGWLAALDEGLKHWQQRNPDGDFYGRDGSEADIEQRERWALNHLRHDCLEYDCLLDEMAGTPGVDDAYGVLRSRCEEFILERYPKAAEAIQRRHEWLAAAAAEKQSRLATPVEHNSLVADELFPAGVVSVRPSGPE